MKVTKLSIKNFRNIKNAELYFEGHTLIIGDNNVGKSTICEALDIVLGPERLNRFPGIEEFDFYNSEYLDAEKNAIKFTIEILLTKLSDEVIRRCGSHLEFWHTEEKRLIGTGEIDLIDSNGEQCLRLIAIGLYNKEEDEFEAGTYFVHSPDAEEGKLTSVNRNIKRLFGFLYLRALRTGNRALSLERGSLLDIILRQKEIRTGLWEETRNRLIQMDPPITEGAEQLTTILKDIEMKIEQYISIANSENITKLFVSKLTREHLRQTISFFLTISKDQVPVPFQLVGAGTLNILVLALLSFIAEIKKDNVIFAMEEPEIALPPSTQRRITNYLLKEITQCFVTTHSPYVIERFEPEQIMLLDRDENGDLAGKKISLTAGLKRKTYFRHIRKNISEAILSKLTIMVEGISEVQVFQTTAQIMEESDNSLLPLDLMGVTFISVDGDGNLSEFGRFFSELKIKTFAFIDKKDRSEDEVKNLVESFDEVIEQPHKGIEELLINEIPIDHQWNFLENMRRKDSENKYHIPSERPSDDLVKKCTFGVLKGDKGDGRSSELVRLCNISEIPISLKKFLDNIYGIFLAGNSSENINE